jgi:hypothetical protein
VSLSDDVRVPVSYIVAVGPTTADAPTSSESALDSDLIDVGYIGSSGLEVARETNSKDITDLVGEVVRTVITDGKVTFKFTLLQSTKEVQEAYWGTTTTGATATDGRLDIVATTTGGRKSWVFDFIDGDAVERYYIASGEVTARDAVTHLGADATAYGMTVTAYPVAGVAVKKWSTMLATP